MPLIIPKLTPIRVTTVSSHCFKHERTGFLYQKSGDKSIQIKTGAENSAPVIMVIKRMG